MSRETHVQFCEGLGVQSPGATHLVMGFEHRAEAERFLQDWRERLRKFGLAGVYCEYSPETVRIPSKSFHL